MFKVGETVNYSTTGVCKIVEIRSERIGGVKRDYYILQPSFRDNSKIFVPVDNEALIAKMRRVLSAEEIYDLIHSMPDKDDNWITDDNKRAEIFKNAIHSGNHADLLTVIKVIYARQAFLSEKGKRLRTSDSVIMQEAENLLYNEFALVLDIKPEQVLPFITNELEKIG